MKKILLLISLLAIALTSWKDDTEGGDPEYSSSKDKKLRKYNLSKNERKAENRNPCDTLSLEDFVVDNYPAGEYLVKFDKTGTYDIPRYAVKYIHDKGSTLILGIIAKSKHSERFIEIYNVIGYESSFINLDSTKLGTAFFFLTMFECDGYGNFSKLWESEVPIHGGFNTIKMKQWKNTPYVELNYEAGIISGHRNYNFFLVDGIRKPPHLMETYEGIVHKRTITDVNGDKYPDYFEYVFSEGEKIQIVDSVKFYWSEGRKLYVTDKNRKWFRFY